MALTAVGFAGSVTLLDEEGSKATLEYALTATTSADAETELAGIVTDLAAVTDAAVGGYAVKHVYAEDTLVLPTGVENEKRAVISAVINGSFPKKYVNIIIPAPSNGIFIATSGPNAKVVDPNDTALRAYLAHFGPGGEATVSDGEVIQDPTTTGAFTGKKTHRGSRNG